MGPMDLPTQGNLHSYFGLQDVMDTQQFRGSLVRSTIKKHQFGLALCDGTKSNKTRGWHYHRGKCGRAEVSDEKAIKIGAMSIDRPTMSF